MGSWNWNRLAPVTPFAGIAVVYVLYRQIYTWTQIGAVDPALPAEAWRGSLDTTGAVADLGARLVWGVAALALILAFAVTVGMCLGAIARSTEGGLRIGLVVASVTAAAVGVWAGLAGNPLTLPKIADELDTGFAKMGLDGGPFLLHLFNGLGMAAAMLLTFAASALLIRDREGAREGSALREGRALREQAIGLRRVLFAGAAVLIAGSTTGAAMHRLPIAYLEPPWSQAFEALAQWTAVATGTLWTLFLIAIYVPAAAILRSRLAQRAEEALPDSGETERRAWIAEHGLDLSPSQQLKRLVVTLGPLLSSLPLAAFFELIGG